MPPSACIAHALRPRFASTSPPPLPPSPSSPPTPPAASSLAQALAATALKLPESLGVPAPPPKSLKATQEQIESWMKAVSTPPLVRFEQSFGRAKKKHVPIVRVQHVDAFGRAEGTGRRKTSVAQVWIKRAADSEMSSVTVNKRPLGEYFSYNVLRMAHVVDVLACVGSLDKFDVVCSVKGGGHGGQAGAIRLGLARALEATDPGLRAQLKAAGMLTRDARQVERKKPGKKKARKSFTFVKR
jgi:small subunit ribosomal protein S9